MSIVGHGIDLVEVARITEMRERHGRHFLERIFRPEEFEPFLDRARCDEHLAARFAAKEAASKALGTGFRGIAWTDIATESEPSGRPALRFRGGAERTAREIGVTGSLLSLTHTGGSAAASVILLGHA